MRSFIVLSLVSLVSGRFTAFSMRPNGNSAIIPLDFTSRGLEIALIGTEEQITAYDGEESCYISEHGQRSAACFHNEHESVEFYTEDSARHHPGAQHEFV